MAERSCSLCTAVATCTVKGRAMCEGHGLYWSKVSGGPMKRFEGHDVEHVWKVGDRVAVAPRGRNDWTTGSVTAIDEPGLPPGVRVVFDRPVNGVGNCYATHRELRPEAQG